MNGLETKYTVFAYNMINRVPKAIPDTQKKASPSQNQYQPSRSFRLSQICLCLDSMFCSKYQKKLSMLFDRFAAVSPIDNCTAIHTGTNSSLEVHSEIFLIVWLIGFDVITTLRLTVFLLRCASCILCMCCLSNCDRIHAVESMINYLADIVEKGTRQRCCKLIQANRD